MLYYLFEYLYKDLNISGTGVFRFITFRAGLAIVLSLLISIVFGKRIIQNLRNRQIGETVRDLGLQGQKEKEGTPTMGGIIIVSSHCYSLSVGGSLRQCLYHFDAYLDTVVGIDWLY
jgi:phospho-N-acetylmuramoyl-pentapeptide-transferase